MKARSFPDCASHLRYGRGITWSHIDGERLFLSWGSLFLVGRFPSADWAFSCVCQSLLSRCKGGYTHETVLLETHPTRCRPVPACPALLRDGQSFRSQVTSSFSVVKKAVPIGSFYRACMTNITTVVVSFSIQQTESTGCCSVMRRIT